MRTSCGDGATEVVVAVGELMTLPRPRRKSNGSRLLVETGNYRDFDRPAAIEASGAQIVTVAIRRVNIGQNAGEPSLLEVLPPSRFTILPNTAGCYTAEDAVRTLRLARELLDGHALVKLEVLGDAETLFPNMPETLAAARTLVAEGFQVMVYCSDDPILARQLEDIGCVAVMPLASLIGSGWASSTRGNCRSSSTARRCPSRRRRHRSRPPTRPSRWSWAATGPDEHRHRQARDRCAWPRDEARRGGRPRGVAAGRMEKQEALKASASSPEKGLIGQTSERA